MTTCKNCNTSFEGKFCSHCGQKNYTDNDKSVKYLIEEAFHFITHFEGTFFTTLKAIFMHPGRLSRDFSNGRRKRYFKPISFYLLIVVIYLLFPFFEGLNMKLGNYKVMALSGRHISEQIQQKVNTGMFSEEQLAERFKEKSHNTSKILLFLFIPFSALLIFVLYPKQKRVWFDNLILATEINIIYLLTLYLIVPILYLLFIETTGLPGLNDELMGFTLTGVFGIYISIIFHNTFKSPWWRSVVKGLTFSYLHTFIILLIYKPLVFEVTWALL